MTGRVCEIHGEYSATGVCRWCEPETPKRDVNDLIGMEAMRERERILGPPPKPLPESAVTKAVRQYYATRSGMAPLFSTRQRYSTPEGVASHNAFWEAKLAEQHAALRWERVARRWNYKHRDSGGLDEWGRAYVWRSWLHQMDRQWMARWLAAAVEEQPP